MAVLHSHKRVVAGALGLSAGSPSSAGFLDTGLAMEDPDGAWEVLAHKYNVSGATFIEHEQLLQALVQVAAVRSTSPATDHFHAQIMRLRELIGVDKGEKSSLAVHFGDRPVENFWPRKNFLLSIFRSFLGELFPERKLLLLNVVDGPEQMDSLLLEFHGHELKGFCEPDFSSVDWKGADLFLPETAARFVSWCENYYMLPAYSIFLTRRVWEDCRELQMMHGEKQAWKFLQKTLSQRDVEKEILFEPRPWPLKALIRWHGMRK